MDVNYLAVSITWTCSAAQGLKFQSLFFEKMTERYHFQYNPKFKVSHIQWKHATSKPTGMFYEQSSFCSGCTMSHLTKSSIFVARRKICREVGIKEDQVTVGFLVSHTLNNEAMEMVSGVWRSDVPVRLSTTSTFDASNIRETPSDGENMHASVSDKGAKRKRSHAEKEDIIKRIREAKKFE
jgi:hypothetical protein